jgi:hypothetical protein
MRATIRILHLCPHFISETTPSHHFVAQADRPVKHDNVTNWSRFFWFNFIRVSVSPRHPHAPIPNKPETLNPEPACSHSIFAMDSLMLTDLAGAVSEFVRAMPARKKLSCNHAQLLSEGYIPAPYTHTMSAPYIPAPYTLLSQGYILNALF